MMSSFSYSAYEMEGSDQARSSRTAANAPPQPQPSDAPRLLERARVAASAAGAAVLGVAPHVLHHAGPLAGAALFAGIGGTLLFGALGFLLAIPLLLRLRRQHGNWRLPAAVLAVFVLMFSLSAFVVGPAITGESGDDQDQEAPPPASSNEIDHEAHH